MATVEYENVDPANTISGTKELSSTLENVTIQESIPISTQISEEKISESKLDIEESQQHSQETSKPKKNKRGRQKQKHVKDSFEVDLPTCKSPASSTTSNENQSAIVCDSDIKQEKPSSHVENDNICKDIHEESETSTDNICKPFELRNLSESLAMPILKAPQSENSETNVRNSETIIFESFDDTNPAIKSPIESVSVIQQIVIPVDQIQLPEDSITNKSKLECALSELPIDVLNIQTQSLIRHHSDDNICESESTITSKAVDSSHSDLKPETVDNSQSFTKLSSASEQTLSIKNNSLQEDEQKKIKDADVNRETIFTVVTGKDIEYKKTPQDDDSSNSIRSTSMEDNSQKESLAKHSGEQQSKTKKKKKKKKNNKLPDTGSSNVDEKSDIKSEGMQIISPNFSEDETDSISVSNVNSVEPEREDIQDRIEQEPPINDELIVSHAEALIHVQEEVHEDAGIMQEQLSVSSPKTDAKIRRNKNIRVKERNTSPSDDMPVCGQGISTEFALEDSKNPQSGEKETGSTDNIYDDIHDNLTESSLVPSTATIDSKKRNSKKKKNINKKTSINVEDKSDETTLQHTLKGGYDDKVENVTSKNLDTRDISKTDDAIRDIVSVTRETEKTEEGDSIIENTLKSDDVTVQPAVIVSENEKEVQLHDEETMYQTDLNISTKEQTEKSYKSTPSKKTNKVSKQSKKKNDNFSESVKSIDDEKPLTDTWKDKPEGDTNMLSKIESETAMESKYDMKQHKKNKNRKSKNMSSENVPEIATNVTSPIDKESDTLNHRTIVYIEREIVQGATQDDPIDDNVFASTVIADSDDTSKQVDEHLNEQLIYVDNSKVENTPDSSAAIISEYLVTETTPESDIVEENIVEILPLSDDVIDPTNTMSPKINEFQGNEAVPSPFISTVIDGDEIGDHHSETELLELPLNIPDSAVSVISEGREVSTVSESIHQPVSDISQSIVEEIIACNNDTDENPKTINRIPRKTIIKKIVYIDGQQINTEDEVEDFSEAFSTEPSSDIIQLESNAGVKFIEPEIVTTIENVQDTPSAIVDVRKEADLKCETTDSLESRIKGDTIPTEAIKQSHQHLLKDSKLEERIIYEWEVIMEIIHSKKRSQTTRSGRTGLQILPMQNKLSPEEVERDVEGNINSIRTAITNKNPVIAQQLIITILESITIWIETIEYKIYKVRKVKNHLERKSKHEHIERELKIVDDKLGLLERVTNGAKDIMHPEIIGKINEAIIGLRTQATDVEQMRKIEEKDGNELEEDYKKRRCAIGAASKNALTMRSQLNAIQEETIPCEEKVDRLENLLVANDDAKDSVHQLILETEKNVPTNGLDEELAGVQAELRTINVSADKEFERLLQMSTSTTEYEETLCELGELIQAAENALNIRVSAKDISQLEDTITKHRRLFTSLRQCQKVLESLDSALEPNKRVHYHQLYSSSYMQASILLDKASKRQHQLTVLKADWIRLQQQLLEETKWLQSVQGVVDNLRTVSSTTYHQNTEACKVRPLCTTLTIHCTCNHRFNPKKNVMTNMFQFFNRKTNYTIHYTQHNYLFN